MNKRYVLILILTLLLSACSQQKTVQPMTKDEMIQKMQQSVKAIDSITIAAQSDVTVTYDKFTTKFTQDTDSQFDTINKSALRIIADSNNTKYPVQSIIFNMDKGNVTAYPEPYYLNYRARNADIQYFSTMQSNLVNLTGIIQNVVKKEVDHIKLSDDTLHYDGSSESLKYLFDYGSDCSSMNQIAIMNDLTDIKVTQGSFDITLSPVHKLPKSLNFELKVDAKIKNKPVHFIMKQSTQFKDFNKTNVKFYKEKEIEGE
ncbi:hypothetical protein ROU88_10800 [Macrococcus capreoli]